MDVTKMLAELRQERDHLDEVILSLERLSSGQGKRRGRPPKWLKDRMAEAPEMAAAAVPAKRGRPAKKVRARSADAPATPPPPADEGEE